MRGWVFALLCAWSAHSLAAGQEPAEASARTHYQQGLTAYDLRQFEQAKAEFSEAYRARPLPGLLFNIAQCDRQLGRLEDAAFSYRRFLDLAPDAPNAPLARELLAGVEKQGRAATREGRAQAAADAPRRADAGGRKMLIPPAAIGPERGEYASSPRELKAAPLLHQWWFWAGVGVAAVSASAIAAATTAGLPPERHQGLRVAR